MDVRKLILIILTTLFSGITSKTFAQGESLQTHLQKAKAYYSRSDFKNAEHHFQAVYKLDNNHLEALTFLFHIYKYQKQKLLLAQTAGKLKNIDAKKSGFYALKELNAYLELQKYTRAKKSLKEIEDNSYCFKNEEVVELNRLKENLGFAEYAVAHPVPFNPINMGKNINSKDAEYLPCLTRSSRTIIYTRHVSDRYSPKSRQEDFFISYKKGSEWTLARPLSKNINSSKNEGAPSFYEEDKILYFSSCNRKDSYGLCDLYYTINKGSYWTSPRNIAELNTPNWESQPCISPDGQTIYFVSDRPGGHGGKDIWAADKVDEHRFGEAYNLGANINTAFDEISPFIHADNNTLYFASNGWASIGNKDIFVSFRQPDGTWSKPVNMGYPINSVRNDNSFFVDADNRYAYFSSNREGGYGKEDIYFFELNEKNRPQKQCNLSIYVMDKNTHQAVNAKYAIWSHDSPKKTIMHQKQGLIQESLNPDKKYMLSIQSEGYVYYSMRIDSGIISNHKHFIDTVWLEPICQEAQFVLQNIEFDFDRSDLKPSSLRELNLFADYLKKMPLIKIRVEGHTDLIGNADYNQTLSEQRAKTVKNYLIQRGVSEKRISSVGFGATKPLQQKSQAKNRRVVIRFL